MRIDSNYDGQLIDDDFPFPGAAVVRDANFKTTQVIEIPGPKNRSFALSRVGVISKAIDTLSDGATIVVSERDYVNGVKASLTTTMSGANNDIVLTARNGGVGGNSISLTLVAQSAPSAPLSVAVAGKDITVNLASGPGTAQVETATVAGTVSGSGNATVTITSPLVPGSPLAIPVAVLNGDTAAVVGGKIRTALGLIPGVSANYTIGGSTTAVSLTAKVATANDGTLNIAIDNGTCAGLTPAATSANTTAGVAPAITTTANQLLAALAANTDVYGLVGGALSGADTGAGVVTALSKTNLTGGVAYSVVQAGVVASVGLADTDSVGKSQYLTLASGVAPIKPGNTIAISITAGTATVDVKDILLEGTVY